MTLDRRSADRRVIMDVLWTVLVIGGVALGVLMTNDVLKQEMQHEHQQEMKACRAEVDLCRAEVTKLVRP